MHVVKKSIKDGIIKLLTIVGYILLIVIGGTAASAVAGIYFGIVGGVIWIIWDTFTVTGGWGGVIGFLWLAGLIFWVWLSESRAKSYKYREDKLRECELAQREGRYYKPNEYTERKYVSNKRWNERIHWSLRWVAPTLIVVATVVGIELVVLVDAPWLRRLIFYVITFTVLIAVWNYHHYKREDRNEEWASTLISKYNRNQWERDKKTKTKLQTDELGGD